MNYVMTKRDRGIIVGIVGILCLAATYYFIYLGYSDKTTQYKNENAALQNRVDVLQSISDQQGELVSKANENNNKANEIMSLFPALVYEEDMVMYGVNMQRFAPLQYVEEISMSPSMEKYRFADIQSATDELVKGYIPDASVAPSDGEQPVEETPAPAPEAGSSEDLPCLYVRPFTILNKTDYDGFKNALRFVIENENRCGLKVDARYDIDTGIIESTIGVDKYYVSGTDEIYEGPDIPVIIQGTDNIFGTIKLDNSKPVNIIYTDELTDLVNSDDSSNEDATTEESSEENE